jgi:alpha-N-arabinofuranosidase
LEKRIRDTEAMIELTDPLRVKGDPTLEWSLPKKKQRIEISVDEWNIWYRKHDFWHRDIPNPEEEVYNLRDALWVATALNLFQRCAKTVTLATMAQLVNILAPMLTSKTGLVLQPTYFPLKLYSQECGRNYLRTRVSSLTFSTRSYADIPYLDLSATTDDSGKTVALSVVNRHDTDIGVVRIRVQGLKVAREVECFEIYGPPNAENTFASPQTIGIQKKSASFGSEDFVYNFPAHSITMLKFARS